MKVTQVIVSDATTLIVLEKQQRLSLLCKLFQKVIIPETVYKELLAGLQYKTPFATASCIQVEKVTPSSQLDNLSILLDLGEAESIELAITKQLPLIIDEKKGRKVAQRLGITITGLAGLLILAVKKEIFDSSQAQVVLDRAMQDSYRLFDSLYQQVM